MGAFADYLPTQGDEWLSGTNGQALKKALGVELDLHIRVLLQGLLARFPQKGNTDANGLYGLPPGDALDQIGADRLLRRGPGESDSAYAARVFAAWDIWTYAGSHYGVLRALQLAGYSTMNIVQQNGRYAHLSGSAGTVADLAFGAEMTCANRPSNPPGWMFDNYDTFYSQFGIVFTTDAANLSGASGQKILIDIVNTWKPAKANFTGAYVILAGQMLGWPTGRTGGTDANLGGNSIRTIPGDGSAPFVTGP